MTLSKPLTLSVLHMGIKLRASLPEIIHGGVKLAEGLEPARPAQGFTVVLCLRHDLASSTNRLAPCSHPASEAVAARTLMAGG